MSDHRRNVQENLSDKHLVSFFVSRQHTMHIPVMVSAKKVAQVDHQNLSAGAWKLLTSLVYVPKNIQNLCLRQRF